jgi:hypothetical protein
MNVDKTSFLFDMVAKIDRADRETHGHPKLEEPLRGRLISALEGCLVDGDRLRGYLQLLQEVLNNHARYDDAACLENRRQRRAIAERGLMALEDADLTRLALNPIALCGLSNHLMESVVTDHWTDVSARAYADPVESRGPPKEAAYRAGSWAHLVDLGPSLFRAAYAALTHDAQSQARIAPRMPDSKSTKQRGQPRVRVAACDAPSDPALREALGDGESKLALLAEFTWQGEQCRLLADMDDARVFAAAPSQATHLIVGCDNAFRLVECKHEGLLLVEGITRPRIRRRIEAGETMGFRTSIPTQEGK